MLFSVKATATNEHNENMQTQPYLVITVEELRQIAYMVDPNIHADGRNVGCAVLRFAPLDDSRHLQLDREKNGYGEYPFRSVDDVQTVVRCVAWLGQR